MGGQNDNHSGTAHGKLAASRAARPEVTAVSGVNSFLGRNLVGLLEEDEGVERLIALDIARPRTAGAKTRFYQVDLTSPAVASRLTEILNAEGVSTFVHLAFPTNPSHATPWAHELQSVGTMHVLNACLERRVTKFVLGSSTLVYGALPSNPNFIDEHQQAQGLVGCDFVMDRIDAERQVDRFAASLPECAVTTLRFAHILGPTVDNYIARWLSRRFVITALGFDPLLQFVHEADALAALKLAIDRDVRGRYNVVSGGVLPVSMLLKLAGRAKLPLPSSLLRAALKLLWATHLVEPPPGLEPCLRFLCVADGERARQELGFVPTFTARDAALDFGGALRLRQARLLHEVGG
ncbi:MAG: NAD-dependent epimerase/dehydratase family protein [Proteobacteria bacterium]|nr:NAD-dependent epimerase/dehydratase family protein [Pseudomonadota bacterium]